MLIKYHDKLCEIDTTLEEGAREFDFLQDEKDLEDTVKFSNDLLENTLSLDIDKIKKVVEDKDDE